MNPNTHSHLSFPARVYCVVVQNVDEDKKPSRIRRLLDMLMFRRRPKVEEELGSQGEVIIEAPVEEEGADDDASEGSGASGGGPKKKKEKLDPNQPTKKLVALKSKVDLSFKVELTAPPCDWDCFNSHLKVCTGPWHTV